MVKIKAKAHVKVLLEVSLSDTWDDNCLLSRVHKQAKDEALNIISQKIADSSANIRVVTKPQVVTVIVEE